MTMKAVVKLFVVCCGILMGVSSFSLVANATDNERIMIHGDDPILTQPSNGYSWWQRIVMRIIIKKA